MRGLQVLPLSKSLVVRIADAVRRFSCCSSQSKNTAYLSPSNPPPVPLIDKNLPYERYSETVRQLRPLFPSTCTLLKPGEVKVIGDTPIGAEGFADIWDGTLNGHRVIQVAYRCYETGEVEHIFRVRNENSSRTAWLTSRFRDTSERCRHAPSSPIRTSSRSSGLIQPQTTLLLSSSALLAMSASTNTSARTPKPTG